ncbi:ABC transporter permease [Pseudomarimonas arenosa]|uniref:ABC transporter permease n=1 Tax=Pseudomarimonas arenosa TaxID=2774145 RepID=A0AAW3ZDE2_9GAMM|nr:ABC transporter permease [Pseudomarimonas arenosa]MBD8524293.1 ABC transporter permease [Pseudomarimonas arenosa]
MTMLLESLRSALASIRAHGLRSFLTTLGIIIGVASVIAVVSLVQGLEHSITSQFEGLGGNSLTVRSDTSFKEAMQGKRNHLTLLDLDRITHYIDDIEDVTPLFVVNIGGDRMLRYQGQSAFTQVVATRSSWQDSRQIYAGIGRFVTNNDERSRRRVVVIGETVRENLKLPEDPIGEFIEMGGEWFKVVGVTEERGEMFGFSQDDFVVIPFSTGMAMVDDPLRQDIQISFNVRNIDDIEPIKDRVTALLRQLHKLKPGERNDFKVQTASQLTESFEAVIGTVTVVLGGIVSVSLLVGGIGIMNIMLVSVTERTREIGISKALGAKRHHILLQFLIEATVLSLLGGIVGILIGYGIGFGAAKLLPGFPDAFVPWWAVALAFGFSTLVGIVFGLMPAAKAAKLDPIEALRYE